MLISSAENPPTLPPPGDKYWPVPQGCFPKFLKSTSALKYVGCELYTYSGIYKKIEPFWIGKGWKNFNLNESLLTV